MVIYISIISLSYKDRLATFTRTTNGVSRKELKSMYLKEKIKKREMKCIIISVRITVLLLTNIMF